MEPSCYISISSGGIASFQSAYFSFTYAAFAWIRLGMSKASSFKLLYSDRYLNLQLLAPLHLWERGEAARSRRAYANVLRSTFRALLDFHPGQFPF
jgi:hypothetical protein